MTNDQNTTSAAGASRTPMPTFGGDFVVKIRAYASPHARPIDGGELVGWLLSEQCRRLDGVALFDELCWRLIGQGIPLCFASLSFGILHPQIRGWAFRWWRDYGQTEQYRIKHGMEVSSYYLNSPFRPAIDEGITIHYRLDDEASLARYQLLREYRDAGATGILVCPLPVSVGQFRVINFVTDRADGFSDRDIAGIEAILPAIGLVAESRALRRINRDLLELYLGRTIGHHILEGEIFRGQNRQLRVALMAVDLRGFTPLADRMPGEDLIQLLNDYFDAVAASVHAQGGEILKFVGDGVLAIFKPDDEADQCAAAAALTAGQETLRRIDTSNENRHAAGQELIRIGIGLHLGEVIYGNVGSTDRLDFTAIGPAVNLVCRLEALTKRLNRPLLVSESLAAASPHPLVSLGFHPVRGLSEPQEVFGLP